MHFSNLSTTALASGGGLLTDADLKTMTDAMISGITSMSTAVLAVIAAGIPAVLGVVAIVSVARFIVRWAKSALAHIG